MEGVAVRGAVLLLAACVGALLPATALSSAFLAGGDALVTGEVWIDENLDGIREVDEPLLPDLAVAVGAGEPGKGKRLFTLARTDGSGRFSIQLKAGAGYVFLVEYSEPGFVRAPPRFSSHKGCTELYLLPSDTNRRANVRARRVIPTETPTGAMKYVAPVVPAEQPVSEGRFFKQMGSLECDTGFDVTDRDGIPFWQQWRQLGLASLGYPISHRFEWSGFTTQVFEKAAFQWQPGRGLFMLNVFDELHDRGLDPQLRATRFAPTQLDPSFDNGKSWEQLVQDRLALLDASPALKDRYFAAPAPLLLYGLPTSEVEDFGPVAVIRTQRTLLQHWEVDLPWARAGDVTVANAGEIAREMGLFPRDPLIAQPPP